MNRITITSNAPTPWGTADTQTAYAAGITFFSTPSYGGFYVAPTTRNAMPEPYRSHPTFCRKPGWYEEDCDWAVVALAFPQLFSQDELDAARRCWTWMTERPGRCPAQDLTTKGQEVES